jgi:hypothetical protein
MLFMGDSFDGKTNINSGSWQKKQSFPGLKCSRFAAAGRADAADAIDPPPRRCGRV